MANIYEEEINDLIKQNNALIEQNNRLIELKKEEIAFIKGKLEKGRIIFKNNLIADSKIDHKDNSIVIKVLVHPNFHINPPNIDGTIPGFDYGIAFDMYVFPLDYLPKVETITIADYYIKHKNEVIDNASEKLSKIDKNIDNIKSHIKKHEEDIAYQKKILEHLENIKGNREDIINDTICNYDEKVQKTVDNTLCRLNYDKENCQHAWKHYENTLDHVYTVGL